MNKWMGIFCDLNERGNTVDWCHQFFTSLFTLMQFQKCLAGLDKYSRPYLRNTACATSDCRWSSMSFSKIGCSKCLLLQGIAYSRSWVMTNTWSWSGQIQLTVYSDCMMRIFGDRFFIGLVAATAFCGFWDGSLPSQDRLLLPNQEAKRPKKARVDQRSIQLGKKLRRDPFIRQICPIFQWQAYIGSAGLLSLYESDQHWSLNIQHEDK